MLSFIVSLVNHYEERHGARPNLVYMNEAHYEYLREELPGIRGHEGIVAMLGVDIALSDSAMHPHVATAKLAAEHILVS
jgi:hypothetical protein